MTQSLESQIPKCPTQEEGVVSTCFKLHITRMSCASGVKVPCFYGFPPSGVGVRTSTSSSSSCVVLPTTPMFLSPNAAMQNATPAAAKQVHPAALKPTIRTSGESAGRSGCAALYLALAAVAMVLVSARPMEVPSYSDYRKYWWWRGRRMGKRTRVATAKMPPASD